MITDEVAGRLIAMSAATMDRRLAPDGAKVLPHGRSDSSDTKPGSPLKSQIPIRSWAAGVDAQPRFCGIDVVGHEGGGAGGAQS